MRTHSPIVDKLLRLRRSPSWLSLLAGAIAVLGCGEPSAPPAAPAVQGSLTTSLPKNADKRASKTMKNMGLPHCDPMPLATTTARIGRSGGRLSVGPHTLDIPAGALHDEVTITAVAPSDTVNLIHFEPEGLVFRKSAALTMSYANCSVSGAEKVQIAYLDDALAVLEYLSSVDKGNRVTGRLDHFSNYAIAW